MSVSSVTGNSTKAIERHLGSSYKVVLYVANHLDDIQVVANAINQNWLADLSTNLSDVLVVSHNIDDVVTVASISDNVVTVANNMSDVVIVSDNIADVVRLRESITEVVRLSQSADNIDRLHGSVDNLDRVFTSIDNVDTVATHIAAVNNVSDNMADVLNASGYVDDIHQSVADAASSATAASNSASASSASATASSNSAAASATSETNAATSEANAAASEQAAANYAASLANGVVFKGDFDASSGNFPTPSLAPERADYYVVTVAGTLSDGAQPDVTVNVGDNLMWHLDKDEWFKVDTTDSVVSVNGQIGSVIVTELNGISYENFVYGDDGRAGVMWRGGISNILKSGFYYVNGDFSDLPVANSGFVLSQMHPERDDYIKQTYTPSNDNTTWVRTMIAGTWGEWKKDITEEWTTNVRTQAQMEEMIRSNTDKYAASGFVHYGNWYNPPGNTEPINEGMWQYRSASNMVASTLLMGNTYGNYAGESKTNFPVTQIAGFVSNLLRVNTGNQAWNCFIKFPEAPDGTVTYNSVTGAVVQHADAATAFAAETADNKVVTERVDMFGGEFFLEEITALNEDIYPYGMIQSKISGSYEGAPLTAGSRPVTYYAVFDGDTTSVGNSWKWSTLTDAQKATIVSNPAHNIFLLDDGRLVQWRMRQRTIAGAGNGDWRNLDSQDTSLGLMYASPNLPVVSQGSLDSAPTFGNSGNANTYRSANNTFNDYPNAGLFTIINNASPRAVNGLCFFHVWGTVPRLNQGAYHPAFNEMGAAEATDGLWYNSSLLTSTVDCFTNNSSGLLGGSSGRDDGRFYDAIYASGQGGVSDDRLSAWDMSSPEEAAKIDAKVKNGTYRGKEVLKLTKVFEASLTGVVSLSPLNNFSGVVQFNVQYGIKGDTVYIEQDDGSYNKYLINTVTSKGNITVDSSALGQSPLDRFEGQHIIIAGSTDLSVEGNFLCRDVVGDPANIIATPDLSEGWYGYWCPTLPTGSAIPFPFQRKYLELIRRQYTLDYGVTWTDATLNGNSTTNETIGYNYPTQSVAIHQYTAAAYVTEQDENRPVFNAQEGLGNVWVGTWNTKEHGSVFSESLTGKIPTNSTGVPQRNHTILGNEFTASGAFNPAARYPEHSPLTLGAPNNDSTAVKALMYQTAENQGLYLNYAYNELVYNSGGIVDNEWGDTVAATTYTNAYGVIKIANGQTTDTNLNGDTILIGTNRLTKRYGYSKNMARASEQTVGVDL